MLAIILALAPLFLLLMAGLTLRKSAFLEDTFWKNLEKLTFWALLPALFLKTMAEADFSGIAVFTPIMAGMALLFGTMGILAALRPLMPGIDGPSYSSIVQGATRFNNYVGLPVVVSLFGNQGVVVYALLMSAQIPLTNVTSVWALSHYASHEPIKWRKLGQLILTNPLIISTLLGIVLSLTHIGLPPVIREIVTTAADASLLTGLLAIGAGLDVGAVRKDAPRVFFSAAMKLLVFPAIAIGSGLLFGLDALSMSVLILFASLPTATSSYILAAHMGGNARLMANIVAAETLLAFATMPTWLWLALHLFPLS